MVLMLNPEEEELYQEDGVGDDVEGEKTEERLGEKPGEKKKYFLVFSRKF